MRQRCDQTGTKWIICYSEDNWNSRSCLLGRDDCGSRGNNDINLEPYELLGNRGVALLLPLRPAIFDSDCSAFDPAKLMQPLHKSSNPRAPSRKIGCTQKPDGPELRSLLRECGERPRGRRAAEQRDELAAFHSITSSASASSRSGTSMPSAFAVLRLITNSNFVDCWTGKSAGFSPLRMRPA